MIPTDEQTNAIDMASTGEHLIVDALAGVGKTTLMDMIARSKGDQRGVYLAFNTAIVKEVQGQFPRNTLCSTTHSYAHKTHGRPLQRRCDGRRVKSAEIARALGIDPIVYEGRDKTERASVGFLAGFVMKGITRFSQTADTEPGWWHIPVPDKMRATPATRTGWDVVRRYLEPFLTEAWADLSAVDGSLPMNKAMFHAVYRKAWALTDPVIPADFILVDEAQDSSDVVLGVLNLQRDRSQIIMCGDANQSIYGWAGATDVMEKSLITRRASLTRSFRFGPEIAAEANAVLGMLPGDMTLIGAGGRGYVGPVTFPDVILCRTNMVAVAELLAEIDRGGRPHIVGGAGDVQSFCEGAAQLQEQGWSSHPELMCFSSWAEVQMYVDDDVLGEDLKILVKLVDTYGAGVILAALRGMPAADMASLVLSTAHRAKGLGFSSVRLAADFPDGDENETVEDDDLRLLYVAVTRAKRELDVESVGLLRPKAMPVPLALAPGTLW